MADPKWLQCGYKISVKLVVVEMEYVFIHAKDNFIAEKNDGMKNLKKNKGN